MNMYMHIQIERKGYTFILGSSGSKINLKRLFVIISRYASSHTFKFLIKIRFPRLDRDNLDYIVRGFPNNVGDDKRKEETLLHSFLFWKYLKHGKNICIFNFKFRGDFWILESGAFWTWTIYRKIKSTNIFRCQLVITYEIKQ